MSSRKPSFIDQKIEELYRSEPIAVSEATNRVRCIMREHGNYQGELNNICYKHLFHEIRPIVSVMKYLEYGAEEIEFTGYTSQIDGILYLPDGRQNIEVTTAINPVDEDKVRRHYLQYGHKPMPNQHLEKRPLEELLRESEKNPSFSIDAKGYDDKVLFPTMQKALCDKVQKSDKNKNYHGAWLILVIDDYVCPPSTDVTTRMRRFDPVCQCLLSNKNRWKPFSRVFVVGISGTYLFDSEAGQGYILSQCGGGIFDDTITD